MLCKPFVEIYFNGNKSAIVAKMKNEKSLQKERKRHNGKYFL